MRAEYRTKRCSECGDDMPYYSRICPFCYYDSPKDGRYDHSSSPYLMMMDLKSLTQEFIELERIDSVGGVFRWLKRSEIDRHWESAVEIETTYGVVYDAVIQRYGRMRTVVESLSAVDDMFVGEAQRRRRSVVKVRRAGRLVVWCILLLVLIVIPLTLNNYIT